ncbi:MAG: hypothetical protein ABIB71_01235 [Candidatus Woesearchaeota archaeon]
MEEEIIDLGIAKIKLKSVEEKKIVVIGNCPFCDKKVRGSTHSQVEWNLVLHIKQKHKDDNEAQILLGQLEEHNKNE